MLGKRARRTLTGQSGPPTKTPTFAMVKPFSPRMSRIDLISGEFTETACLTLTYPDMLCPIAFCCSALDASLSTSATPVA